jgi:hypothetical protein
MRDTETTVNALKFGTKIQNQMGDTKSMDGLLHFSVVNSSWWAYDTTPDPDLDLETSGSSGMI